MEKAPGLEKTISMKEYERERHDFDPITFYKTRLWKRRSDTIVINKNPSDCTSQMLSGHQTGRGRGGRGRREG